MVTTRRTNPKAAAHLGGERIADRGNEQRHLCSRCPAAADSVKQQAGLARAAFSNGQSHGARPRCGRPRSLSIGVQSPMALPIEQLTLYKHGLGFFERGGAAEASFTLEFPRRAMDDVLKSLTVLPANATVSGVAFETPPDRNPEAQRQPLHINAEQSYQVLSTPSPDAE